MPRTALPRALGPRREHRPRPITSRLLVADSPVPRVQFHAGRRPEPGGKSHDGRVRTDQTPGQLADHIEQRIVEAHLGTAAREAAAARAHAGRGQPEESGALPALREQATRQLVTAAEPPRPVGPAELLCEEAPGPGAVTMEDDCRGRV